MLLLAIDTSCDESCAAIVDTQHATLKANVVASHVAKMRPYGGVMPEIVSREHLTGLPYVVGAALLQAECTFQDLDWICVTQGPGLMGCLLVGTTYAQALAMALKRPLSGMDHLEGHLFSPLISALEGKGAAEVQAAPPFPWVALIASGGHTELYYVESATHCRRLGGTRDDAAGEAFDKLGKLLGFEYPAGPALDAYVKRHATESDFTAFRFPQAQVGDSEFSFSGLKTAVRIEYESQRHALKMSPGQAIPERVRVQLAASIEHAVVEALADKCRKNLAQFSGAHLVVTGGVACNSRLRARLPEAYFPLPRFCTDNAAMIAARAHSLAMAGRLEPSLSWISPYATSRRSFPAPGTPLLRAFREPGRDARLHSNGAAN